MKMSSILFLLSMVVIICTFFMELTDIQLLQYITVWGFLFLAAILSGIKVHTQIVLPKDILNDRDK
jgi:hypothetical protein